MSDCKNALVEANGDMDQAIDILRKKGLAKAAKRAGNETSEGKIKIVFGSSCLFVQKVSHRFSRINTDFRSGMHGYKNTGIQVYRRAGIDDFRLQIDD